MKDRTEEELKAIFDEISTQTDRGAAIVAAAILEEYLTIALKNRLILTVRLEERIFSIDRKGFASEFGSKIDLALCCGLIRQDVFDDLRLIAKIRNRFAHHVTPLKFSEPSIKEWCDTIKMVDADEPRHRYVTACGFLCGLFGAKAVSPNLRIKRVGQDPALKAEIETIIDSALPD